MSLVSKLRSAFALSLLPNHYPAIHGLRVLGIVSIIQIHLAFELAARGRLPRDGLLFAATQRVWFGMDLFFVLSGFLIGNILLSAEGAASSALDARKILRFYARRSFRILPLYYVVLFALALAKPLDPLQRAQFPRELFYLTNYSDTRHVVMFWGWSLCVEEHFYLLVPFLVIALGKLRSHGARLALLCVLWASALGVRALVVGARSVPLDAVGYFRHVYIATHTRYDTLIAGVILAYLHRHFGEALRAAFDRAPVRRSAIVVSLGLLTMIVWPPPFLTSVQWNLLALGTFTTAGWVLVLLHVLYVDSPFARFLGRPIFLRLATVGYGVYLVHLPLVLLVGIPTFVILQRALGAPDVVAFVVGVAAAFASSLLYAYGLHLVVEKPALFARDRLVPSGATARPDA